MTRAMQAISFVISAAELGMFTVHSARYSMHSDPLTEQAKTQNRSERHVRTDKK